MNTKVMRELTRWRRCLGTDALGAMSREEVAGPPLKRDGARKGTGAGAAGRGLRRAVSAMRRPKGIAGGTDRRASEPRSAALADPTVNEP